MDKNMYIDVPGQSEDALQQKCYFWFNNEYPNLRGMFFAIPNGSAKSGRQAKIFKLTGLVPGVADTCLLYQGKANWIEMKRDSKAKQSPAQIRWEQKVRFEGFGYFLCISLSHFKMICKLIIK